MLSEILKQGSGARFRHSGKQKVCNGLAQVSAPVRRSASTGQLTGSPSLSALENVDNITLCGSDALHFITCFANLRSPARSTGHEETPSLSTLLRSLTLLRSAGDNPAATCLTARAGGEAGDEGAWRKGPG